MGKAASRKTTCLLLGVSFLAMGSLMAFFSLAWFAKPQTHLEASDIQGELRSSYFSGGDGSQGDPYQISNAKQVYYFSWLQDLGYFNQKKEGTDEIEQIYFKLTEDIDMQGYSLPPAGTEEYPFLGHFEGDGHTLSNAAITNVWDDLKDKPSNAKQDGDVLRDAEIIGFFGIIGEYPNGTAYSFSSEINSVSNLYFEDISVSSSSSNVLGGLIAGYVNGSLSYCGVRSGNLSFADNASPIQDNLFGASNDMLSKYTLIGDYNPESFVWNGKPGGGQDNDWGGSIDMMTLARRATYIKNNQKSSYHMTLKEQTGINFNWLDSSTYADLDKDSYLPLNVDLDKTQLIDISGRTDTSSGFYSGNSEEPILGTNSGYITGIGSQGSSWSRIRVNAYPGTTANRGFSNSIKRVNGGNEGSSDYDLYKNETGNPLDKDLMKSNIALLTYSFEDSSPAIIRDPSNRSFADSISQIRAGSNTLPPVYVDSSSFERYSSVKASFIDMIYDATNAYRAVSSSSASSKILYMAGLRFYNNSGTGKVESLGAKNVSLFGESRQWNLNASGIQFELKRSGYITCVVSKFDSPGSSAFYDLYSVSPDGALGSQIHKIQRSSGGEIVYDGDSSNQLLFDFDQLDKTATAQMYSNYAYYFEIPVKAGSYFITSPIGSGSSPWPYFLYLDIGANANGSGGGETPVTPDIDFVYKNQDGGIAKINEAGYVPSEVTFSISGSSSRDVFYFWRRSSSSGVSYYHQVDAYIVNPEGIGGSHKASGKDEYEG